MANKCSNCGFEYGEFDIYCSRCGHKIGSEDQIQTNANEVYEKYIAENDIETKQLKSNVEFFLKRKGYESNIFDAFAIIFLVSIVLTVLVFMLSNKQHDAKRYLEYKSLISRPSQIPLLKNTENVEEFFNNLYANEHFLKLYLKYSKDDSKKKEQIFYTYMNELFKLENFTNENMLSQKHPECEIIKTKPILNRCEKYYNSVLKNSSAKVYKHDNVLYFYPDKKLIYKKYSKLVSIDMRNFLKLESKFPTPVALNGTTYLKPAKSLDKIKRFEKLYNNDTNQKIKALLEINLFNDVKNLIFTWDMYATTTQEMKPKYKYAFNHFIRRNKYSALSSLFTSYIDKQKQYTQDNFAKDYPYKIFDDNFYDNVENSTFKDIFAQLRKNLAADSDNNDYAYVYNLISGKWIRYKEGMELSSHNYIISFPDENNNVFFYNFAFSPIQELNIQENSNLFINSGQIFIYNYDKLSISKITFNGKLFNTKLMNYTDITTLFPGINVINIDSTDGYNIYVEKVNKNANFIILSRYAQGLSDYEIATIKGEIKKMALSNMFSVNTNEEVILSFHSKTLNQEETSEQKPTYKIHIYTIGQPKTQRDESKPEFVDKETPQDTEDEDIEEHTPTIKPKIETDVNDALILPPSKNLEPLKDEE